MSDLLLRSPFLQPIPLTALPRLVRRGRKRIFPAGSKLMRQGDPSDCMYVLLTGRVQIERSHPQLTTSLILAELGPGEVVYELGMLEPTPRTATVTAIEDSEVLELVATTLTEAVQRFPEVVLALPALSPRRLPATDEQAVHQCRDRVRS